MNAKQDNKLNVETSVDLEMIDNIDDNLDENENLDSSELVFEESNDKEIKKFNNLYRRSYKQSLANEASLKEVDAQYLKKIKNKRNEIISLKKKIDTNNTELEKAYEKFKEIYYHDVNDEMILDTKDKALAQKTLLYRKSVRDIETKLEKQEKEYNELIKNKEDVLVNYKKSFTQTIMDLERRKKGEIQKGRKAKAEENARLNEMLSETNDRIRINAINERLNNIKKESLEGSKEINIKYTNLRKEEDLKNITYLMEYDRDLLNINLEYEKNKFELLKQQKQAELDYYIESQTYILAAKRADNNLKKDIVIKKNGVLVSIYDDNQNLYKKMTNASIELLNLQENYNKNVLSRVLKENMDRTSLVLSKIKYVSNSMNNDMNTFFEKASPAFIQSLFYTNGLIHKNLKRIVNSELNNNALYIKNAYDANARSLENYANINQKIEDCVSNYKKECSDLVNQLFILKNKENKEMLRFIPSLDDSLKNIAKERNEQYKQLMDKVNHIVIAFASSQDVTINKYKNDEEMKKALIEEKAKYFIGDYKSAEEEMKAIEMIHSQYDKQIDLDINQLNIDIENKKKELEQEITSKDNEFINERKEKLEAIESKYKTDCENLENNFKENMKTITGDYKTENKLL